MPYAVVLSALIALQQPQDTPKQSREEVIKGLEAKFAAAGPLSAELTLKSEVPGAKEEISGRGSLYLSREDRCLYLRMTYRKEGKDLPERFMFGKGNAFKMWGGGDKAVMLDYERSIGSLFKTVEASEVKLEKILGRPPVPRSDPSILDSGYPIVVLSLEADGDQASFRSSIGSSSKKGSVSWFDKIREESEGPVRNVDGAVEFEIASQRMAITVDATTGFIRTIRLRLKNEVIKTLEVTAIRRSPERPRPLFPDRFTVPIPGIESVKDRINAGAYSMGRWTVDAILTDLDRERILRKASDLKHYYRGLMEDFCRSVSEAILAAYADLTVAKLKAKGNSLEDLERQIDEFANIFEKVVKEGESVRAELVESMVTKTHDGLLECIKEAEKGTPESKAELEKIIREVLKDSKDPKFLPAIPDAKVTVRQAIQRAKDAE